MPYLSAADIEARIAALGATAPCSRIPMQNPTVSEGIGPTTYSYLKIGNGSGPGRPTVFAVAGMHARELAQPDAVLSFAEKLLTAYRTTSAFVIPAYTDTAGNTFGPVSMPAATVKRLVDSVDLLLVPLANPDGRAFALSAPANLLWRKNRAARVVAADPATVGVDLNRNFDIAWDFDVYYNPAGAAAITATTSKDAADDTFIGQPAAGAASQPETRNLVWILDHNPVTYVIDLHSKKGKVMFPWGIEANGTNPAQTFRDHGLDNTGPLHPGVRDGVTGAAYSEFFSPAALPALLHRHTTIAGSIRDGIRAATGRTYGTGGIAQTLYPATGSLTDYAFSRQFTIAASPPIYSFALEFGFDADTFQPFYGSPEGFPKIEREIHAALLRFVEAAIPPAAPSSGGTGGSCPFTIAVLGIAGGPVSLATLREGRSRLLSNGRTRQPMIGIDRAYRRLGRRLGPAVARHVRARWVVAHLVVRPLAAITDGLLRLGAK